MKSKEIAMRWKKLCIACLLMATTLMNSCSNKDGREFLKRHDRWRSKQWKIYPEKMGKIDKIEFSIASRQTSDNKRWKEIYVVKDVQAIATVLHYLQRRPNEWNYLPETSSVGGSSDVKGVGGAFGASCYSNDKWQLNFSVSSNFSETPGISLRGDIFEEGAPDALYQYITHEEQKHIMKTLGVIEDNFYYAKYKIVHPVIDTKTDPVYRWDK